MKSVIIICPYFGKFPEYVMPLWLRSISFNKTINWLIITDDKSEYNYPSNVKVVYSSLNETKSHFQKHFDFDISLERPYKLCDYRPAYGVLFSDYTKGYDYWGYCDIGDTIFGDLRSFINDAMNSDADKIMYFGHLSLYRNVERVNKAFLLHASDKSKNIKNVFGVNESCIFDEIGEYSIHRILLDNGFNEVRLDSSYIDISPMRFAFSRSLYDKDFKHLIDYSRRIISWENGKLYDCVINNGMAKKTEIGYVHFQKRKMKWLDDNVNTMDSFLIVPNGFAKYEKPTKMLIQKYSTNKLFYEPYFKIKMSYLKTRLRHFRGKFRL